MIVAQKLGLVASPKERLTEEDWIEVKKRSLLREESAQPCTICREEFRLHPQVVLLSCSHVFHRTCLQAFERFSGRKRCPICRREQYETRVIHDAARLFRHQCAIRIQAHWRGYSARKSYREIRRTKCPKDKKLRRRFFEDRLQELNDSFVRYCHTDTEDFLRDIDRSLSSSRQVFQQLERKRASEPAGEQLGPNKDTGFPERRVGLPHLSDWTEGHQLPKNIWILPPSPPATHAAPVLFPPFPPALLGSF
ncbi:RING finger protein 32 [Oryzias melastigma]|uniref:RING finger protein 32 n=1 Tax=Oryzias melastigma TaxID=30732 RepID=A0A834FNZ1_ORYME|nr:RING finger protein 32 [Oryzias melastigma]